MQKQPSVLTLSFLHALGKGFSVFYFILLTVFYARGQISNAQIGYIGALFILFVIAGAGLVAHWLHRHTTRSVLIISAIIAVFVNTLLLLNVATLSHQLLYVIYALMGLAIGTSMSGANAVAARITKKGERFHTLAKLGMLTDIVRIALPIAVASGLAIGSLESVVASIVLLSLLFLLASLRIPNFESAKISKQQSKSKILANSQFRFILSIEFLDSFSSSQLFVFLPVLFLAKGFTIQNSLLLQSAIFLGYLSGRWLIGFFASRHSGEKAVAWAEIGLVLSILLLLLAQTNYTLYLLSYLLGIFARGTSPAIKALSFDSLSEAQMKRGSALHVVAGDSGSMLGQLVFGLLLAWLGVEAPFLLAAGVSTIIALLLVGNSRTSRS
jgi:FSR family fosmidomycin resistance protein-like MFS transporter